MIAQRALGLGVDLITNEHEQIINVVEQMLIAAPNVLNAPAPLRCVRLFLIDNEF